MGHTLQFILSEFNPVHDLDRLYENLKKIKDGEKISLQPHLDGIIESAKHGIKYLARGGLVGGAVGAATGYLTDGNYQEGFLKGAFLGALFDASQFWARFIVYYRELTKAFDELDSDKPTKHNI